MLQAQTDFEPHRVSPYFKPNGGSTDSEIRIWLKGFSDIPSRSPKRLKAV